VNPDFYFIPTAEGDVYINPALEVMRINSADMAQVLSSNSNSFEQLLKLLKDAQSRRDREQR
jgi:hypothetical protein